MYHLGIETGYSRLSTLEVGGQSHVVTSMAESDLTSKIRHFCCDLHHQLEMAYTIIDGDRIFMTILATISLALVVYAFFPYLQSQLAADQKFRHHFVLDSLIVSKFQASADQFVEAVEGGP